ncbi:MAG: hypothetical protein JW976_11020 [Syntrophaceae bacterium]|nr:hypothetical protein [Syntrophaceae bacterium]
MAKSSIDVTQGEVACMLALYLGIDISNCDTTNKAGSVIFEGECCIGALKTVGIIIDGGWNAGATVDAAFIGKLFMAVDNASRSGSLRAPSDIATSSAITAAALTASGLDPATVIASIVAAGGNGTAAQKGAAAGKAAASAKSISDVPKISSIVFPDAPPHSGYGGGGGSATQSR